MTRRKSKAEHAHSNDRSAFHAGSFSLGDSWLGPVFIRARDGCNLDWLKHYEKSRLHNSLGAGAG